MKYIILLIFFLILTFHLDAQLWEYPYNTRDFTDNKNEESEAKKGIKVEKVTTKDFQQEYIDYIGYDTLGRIIFELSDLMDTLKYTYNSDNLWITSGFGNKINTRVLNYDNFFNLINVQISYFNGTKSNTKYGYDISNNLILVYEDSLNKIELSYYVNNKVKEIKKFENNHLSKKLEVFNFRYNGDTVFYSKCYFYDNDSNLNTCDTVYGIYNSDNQIIKIVSKSFDGISNNVYTSNASYNQFKKLVKVVNHYETGSKATVLYFYNKKQHLIKIEQYTDEDLQSEIFYDITYDE